MWHICLLSNDLSSFVFYSNRIIGKISSRWSKQSDPDSVHFNSDWCCIFIDDIVLKVFVVNINKWSNVPLLHKYGGIWWDIELSVNVTLTPSLRTGREGLVLVNVFPYAEDERVSSSYFCRSRAHGIASNTLCDHSLESPDPEESIYEVLRRWCDRYGNGGQ